MDVRRVRSGWSGSAIAIPRRILVDPAPCSRYPDLTPSRARGIVDPMTPQAPPGPPFTVSVDAGFDDSGFWLIDARIAWRDGMSPQGSQALGEARMTMLIAIAREAQRGRSLGYGGARSPGQCRGGPYRTWGGLARRRAIRMMLTAPEGRRPVVAPEGEPAVCEMPGQQPSIVLSRTSATDSADESDCQEDSPKDRMFAKRVSYGHHLLRSALREGKASRFSRPLFTTRPSGTHSDDSNQPDFCNRVSKSRPAEQRTDPESRAAWQHDSPRQATMMEGALVIPDSGTPVHRQESLLSRVGIDGQ